MAKHEIGASASAIEQHTDEETICAAAHQVEVLVQVVKLRQVLLLHARTRSQQPGVAHLLLKNHLRPRKKLPQIELDVLAGLAVPNCLHVQIALVSSEPWHRA